MYQQSYYSCGIIAKKSGKLEQIANHLRYWPFVKYYCFIDEHTILMGVCLGTTRNHRNRVRLYKRTRKLLGLCLRQYDVELTRWKRDVKGFIPPYSDDLYVRPTSTVKSFSFFLKELDRCRRTLTLHP